MATVYKYRIYCNDESTHIIEDVWRDDGDIPSSCPNNASHTIDEDKTSVFDQFSSAEVSVNNRPEVEVRKPSGETHSRVYGFAINFCDKTTWRSEAVKITDEEVGTGNGATTTFDLDHGDVAVTGERVIDLSHGKITDENNILPPGETLYREMGNGYQADGELSGYVPIVKLDGVEKSEREYAADSGGDYTIDYVNGQITFFVAPATDVAITATYWYVPVDGCACIAVVPPTGKKYTINSVEIQADTEAIIKDDIIMNVYAGAAPPDGTAIERPTVIKNILDVINWSRRSYPQIPAQGGAGARGLATAVNIHRVEYDSAVPLLSSQLMYMRVHLRNGVEFSGNWATVVIYGIDEDE